MQGILNCSTFKEWRKKQLQGVPAETSQDASRTRGNVHTPSLDSRFPETTAYPADFMKLVLHIGTHKTGTSTPR